MNRVAGIFLFLASLQGIAAGPLWERQPDLPVGIAGFALGAHDGALHVAGGSAWENSVKLTLDRRWSWRPGDAVWVEKTRLPRPFAYGAHDRFGATLVLAGGSSGTKTCNDIVFLSPEGAPPEPVKLPHPSAFCGSAIDGNTLYLLGGTTDIDDLAKLNASFMALDLASGGVEILPDYPGGPALHPKPVVRKEQIIVFPGATYDMQQARVVNGSATWAYEPASRRWMPRAEYPFAVRGLAVCALDSDRHILTAGGVRSTSGGESAMTAECFLYDAVTDSFLTLPTLPYAAMLMGAVRIGDWVYVLGGEDRARHRAAQVFRARISDLLAAAR